MINVTKSPKPTFAINYHEQQTRDLIKDDFLEMCYLCERYVNIDYEIDHFYPQKHFPKKENDWDNLFYICQKCNKIRPKSINSNKKNEVLNCCVKNESDLIELKIDESTRCVSITSNNFNLQLSDKVSNTIGLLENIYNNKQNSNSDFSLELRIEILKQLASFVDIIEEYKLNDLQREYAENKIKNHICIQKIRNKYQKNKAQNKIYKQDEEPCFISFKRSIIKEDSNLYNTFKTYFD